MDETWGTDLYGVANGSGPADCGDAEHSPCQVDSGRVRLCVECEQHDDCDADCQTTDLAIWVDCDDHGADGLADARLGQ